MDNNPLHRTLLGVGVAIALGVGTAACSDATTPSSDTTTQMGDSRTGDARGDVSDTVVTTNVRTRLTSDNNTASSDIQVMTNNGVVTLEGTVDSEYAKSAAESIARSVEGVERVNNNLVASASAPRSNEAGRGYGASAGMDAGRSSAEGMVDEAGRIGSDTWITTQVKSLLLADSVGRGLEINVDTRDGIVTLEGAIDDENTIEHVSEIAADVEGVRRVDTDRLVVATRD